MEKWTSTLMEIKGKEKVDYSKAPPFIFLALKERVPQKQARLQGTTWDNLLNEGCHNPPIPPSYPGASSCWYCYYYNYLT